MQDIPKLNSKELMQFGIILGLLVALIFGILIPWLWGWAYFPNYLVVFTGGLISIFSVLFPSKVEIIYKPYMRLALVIGSIINFIVLGTVFFLLISFMSVFLRLLKIDLFNGKYKNKAKTYRIESDTPKKNHFERPF